MSKMGRGDRAKNNRIKALITELLADGLSISAISKELQHSYKHTKQVVEQIRQEKDEGDE